MNAANITNTTRTLCHSVAGLGGNKKCARVPTNAEPIRSREAKVEGNFEVRTRLYLSPEARLAACIFDLGHSAVALSKFPIGYCVQPMTLPGTTIRIELAKPPFCFDEASCAVPYATDPKWRAAMQFAAFFEPVPTQRRYAGHHFDRPTWGNRHPAGSLPVKDRGRSNG